MRDIRARLSNALASAAHLAATAFVLIGCGWGSASAQTSAGNCVVIIKDNSVSGDIRISQSCPSFAPEPQFSIVFEPSPAATAALEVVNDTVVADIDYESFGVMETVAPVRADCRPGMVGAQMPMTNPANYYRLRPDDRSKKVAFRVSTSFLTSVPTELARKAAKDTNHAEVCFDWTDAFLWLKLKYENYSGKKVDRHFRIDAYRSGQLTWTSVTKAQYEDARTQLLSASTYLGSPNAPLLYISGPAAWRGFLSKVVSKH